MVSEHHTGHMWKTLPHRRRPRHHMENVTRSSGHSSSTRGKKAQVSQTSRQVMGQYSPTVEPRQISSTSTFTRSSNHSPPPPLQHAQHSSGYPCMPPIEIKTAGIDKLISELYEHKACGPDGIRPIIVKRLRASISPTLQCTFSKSLAEGQVPDDWKHATVTPLHKKGNRNDPANYRPISLTCVCCKLMEHIVVSNSMRHLEANHSLNPNQHGFRKGLSCEPQLVEFSQALLTTIHIGHQTDIIILDFAKAFDKVNHNKLIHKLKAHRVDMLTVERIEAFLSNISQIVVLDGTSSDSVPVTSGVPQGSVLAGQSNQIRTITDFKPISTSSPNGQLHGTCCSTLISA